MNYFKFFEIPEGLKMDPSELRSKFLANAKKFHPDHQDQSDAQALEAALKNSATNNEAFSILSNQELRTKHLLEIHGYLTKENEGALPQEFLFEMMELNEEIMEAKMDASLTEGLDKKIQSFEHSLDQQYQKFEQLHVVDINLDDLVTFYLKSKYLKRLKENLNSESPEI